MCRQHVITAQPLELLELYYNLFLKTCCSGDLGFNKSNSRCLLVTPSVRYCSNQAEIYQNLHKELCCIFGKVVSDLSDVGKSKSA